LNLASAFNQMKAAKMKLEKQLLIQILTAGLGFVYSVQGQSFKLDSIQYDSFGGLAQLRWESQPGRIYSVHSSTNLMLWEETRSVGQLADADSCGQWQPHPGRTRGAHRTTQILADREETRHGSGDVDPGQLLLSRPKRCK
jgi:hypothetical protein